MRDEILVEEIKRVLTDSLFHGEGYRKVWERLRFKGIRTSKRCMLRLRLMLEHGLLAPQRVGQPHGPKAHDGSIAIEGGAMRCGGTDLTSTWTLDEGQVVIFAMVDRCSAECVGIHAAKYAARFEALEPIRQGVREHFGLFAEGIAIVSSP